MLYKVIRYLIKLFIYFYKYYRTGVTLALDLPRLFWKLIVGEKVFKKDLEEIEKSFQNLNKNIKTGSKEEVEYYLNELGLIDENS